MISTGDFCVVDEIALPRRFNGSQQKFGLLARVLVQKLVLGTTLNGLLHLDTLTRQLLDEIKGCRRIKKDNSQSKHTGGSSANDHYRSEQVLKTGRRPTYAKFRNTDDNEYPRTQDFDPKSLKLREYQQLQTSQQGS